MSDGHHIKEMEVSDDIVQYCDYISYVSFVESLICIFCFRWYKRQYKLRYSRDVYEASNKMVKEMFNTQRFHQWVVFRLATECIYVWTY